MHKILKLQHHRHSGKLLPHHHTSYRTLGLLMVLTGACLIVMQHSAGADSLYVRAKLSAPLPTIPAIILAPDDGYQTTTGLVTVSGTCPSATPPNIVVITEDSVPIASTPCLPDDTFSIQVMLSAGTIVLAAQIFNITEDPGPSSPAITATYTPTVPSKPTPPTVPPAPPSPETPPASNPTPTSNPTTGLNISTERPFFTYGPNSPVTWKGSFKGGTPPYIITFAWGDGMSNTYTVDDSETHQFSHFYQTIGLYYITVTIVDAAGNSFTNTYASVSPYVPRDEQTDTEAPTGLAFTLPNNNDTNIVIFTVYALTTAVVGLIWFNAHTAHHLKPALQHSYNKPKSTQRTPKNQANRANSNKRSARSSTRKR